ncbi:MAG: glutaredoxin family protein [Deltaproteobacteria bacterium]|nr:glutaredoxin family protein [Deltaproteobacteria bacterium]
MASSIKIYTLSTCSHCKAAKRLFNELGVDYDFTDVDLLTGEDRKAAINEVRQYNPQVSFPTIVIGDKIIVGNKETEIKEALGL